MSKAQETNRSRYWAPLELTKMPPLSNNRATNVYARHASYRQNQGDNSGAGPQQSRERGEASQGMCRKRRADALNDDGSDDDCIYTSKAPRRTLEETQLGDAPAVDEQTALELQDDRQRPIQGDQDHLAVTISTNIHGANTEDSSSLATLKARLESLESTAEQHADDIGYLLPWLVELVAADQAMGKRVDWLEVELCKTNDQLAKTLDVLESMADLLQETNTTLRKTKVALGVAKHALAENGKRLGELKGQLSDATEGMGQMKKDVAESIGSVKGWITSVNHWLRTRFVGSQAVPGTTEPRTKGDS
ncbi:hypothetical protein ACJZ2D_007056 [Fusarium nematophilum]